MIGFWVWWLLIVWILGGVAGVFFFLSFHIGGGDWQ